MTFRISSPIIIGLLLLLSSACTVNKTTEPNNGGSSVSPYVLTVDQPDGTKIDVLGKGNMNNPYTETVDGYTLLKNEKGIYEYAIISSYNILEPGGVKAKNEEDRSKRDIRFLNKIDKHLRKP